MDAEQRPRALPEIIPPIGVDGLIPSTAAAFADVERLVLERPAADAAAVILTARRRQLASGAGWLEVDLPADPRPRLTITARREGTAVIGGEPIDAIAVEVASSIGADAPGDPGVDHWSLDLDHDGLVHRTMLTGDGAPPLAISGTSPPHDADRVVQLRVVNRLGLVSTSSARIPAVGW